MPNPAWAEVGEALVGIAYLLAAYQDLRSREVDDLTWAPAAAGLALLLVAEPVAADVQVLAKVGLMAALAVAWRRMGLMASGDLPALAFLGASACYLSPLPELAASMPIVLAIWAVEAGLRARKIVGIEEAALDPRWIPRRILGEGGEELEDLSRATPEEASEELGKWKEIPGARVELSYGVPLAAAVGLGYVAAHAALLAMGIC